VFEEMKLSGSDHHRVKETAHSVLSAALMIAVRTAAGVALTTKTPTPAPGTSIKVEHAAGGAAAAPSQPTTVKAKPSTAPPPQLATPAPSLPASAAPKTTTAQPSITSASSHTASPGPKTVKAQSSTTICHHPTTPAAGPTPPPSPRTTQASRVEAPLAQVQKNAVRPTAATSVSVVGTPSTKALVPAKQSEAAATVKPSPTAVRAPTPTDSGQPRTAQSKRIQAGVLDERLIIYVLPKPIYRSAAYNLTVYSPL